jgi:hypothetical protein
MKRIITCCLVGLMTTNLVIAVTPMERYWEEVTINVERFSKFFQFKYPREYSLYANGTHNPYHERWNLSTEQQEQIGSWRQPQYMKRYDIVSVLMLLIPISYKYSRDKAATIHWWQSLLNGCHSQSHYLLLWDVCRELSWRYLGREYISSHITISDIQQTIDSGEIIRQRSWQLGDIYYDIYPLIPYPDMVTYYQYGLGDYLC